MPLLDYVQIQVNKCDNSSSEIPCKSLADMTKFFEDKHVDIFIPDISFDLNNYDNPKVEFLRMFQNKIALPFIKSSMIYLQKTQFIDDKGLQN